MSEFCLGTALVDEENSISGTGVQYAMPIKQVLTLAGI